MNRTEKQGVVERLRAQFQGSAAVICIDFRGVNVEKITHFRRQLSDVAGDYHVVKNTLVQRAIQDTAFVKLEQFLTGPTGIVFCPDAPVEQAKIVSKFMEDTAGALCVKGGMIGGAVFDAQEIKQVATLPSRHELLARLVTALQSPISGLVGTLEGIVRELVYTLQAVADQKASKGESNEESIMAGERDAQGV